MKREFSKRKSWKEIKDRYYFIPKISYRNINCPNFKFKAISVLFLNTLYWYEF